MDSCLFSEAELLGEVAEWDEIFVKKVLNTVV